MERKIMSKQIWKAGNMVYPLPAVMVSCQRPGEKANIITSSMDWYRLYESGHALHFRKTGTVFLRYHP